MEKYRRRLDPSALPAASTSQRVHLGYNTLGIPSSFNVMDDEDMNWNNTSLQTPSVESEYQGYLNSARRPIDIDLVNFWEVSTLRCQVFILSMTFPLDSQRGASDSVLDRNGLLTNPGVFCSLRESILL